MKLNLKFLLLHFLYFLCAVPIVAGFGAYIDVWWRVLVVPGASFIIAVSVAFVPGMMARGMGSIKAGNVVFTSTGLLVQLICFCFSLRLINQLRNNYDDCSTDSFFQSLTSPTQQATKTVCRQVLERYILSRKKLDGNSTDYCVSYIETEPVDTIIRHENMILRYKGIYHFRSQYAEFGFCVYCNDHGCIVDSSAPIAKLREAKRDLKQIKETLNDAVRSIRNTK